MTDKDYIYEVYKERSFSAAAKNLFVSQPALSTSVKRAETALGITIFDRSTSPITLTEAGRVYIESLEAIRQIEANTKQKLADLSGLRSGHIVVSGENFVSSFIIPKILRRFGEKYCGINVELVESNSPDLRELLITEQIDLLIAHEFDPTLYDAEPLCDEIIMLAVPKDAAVNRGLEEYALTLDDIRAGKHRTMAAPDLALFRSEKFLLLKKGNDMETRAEKFCDIAGFTPDAVIRLDQLITSYNLAEAGMGLAFVPDSLIKAVGGDGCLFYATHPDNCRRHMYIGYKKNRYLSCAMKAFIDTANEVYSK